MKTMFPMASTATAAGGLAVGTIVVTAPVAAFHILIPDAWPAPPASAITRLPAPSKASPVTFCRPLAGRVRIAPVQSICLRSRAAGLKT